MANRRRVFPLVSCEVVLTDRSIAELGEPVDAIVSSDDGHLTHGGGVSAALWRKAGPELEAWLETFEVPAELGTVVDSPAGALEAGVLLHAISIDLTTGRAIGVAELDRLIDEVIVAAEQLGAYSLAVPLLASGAAGVAPERSARKLGQALRAYDAAGSPLRQVIVCAMGGSYVLAERALAEVFDGGSAWTLPLLATATGNLLGKRLESAYLTATGRGEGSPTGSDPRLLVFLTALAATLEVLRRKLPATAPDELRHPVSARESLGALVVRLRDHAQALEHPLAEAEIEVLLRTVAARNLIAHSPGGAAHSGHRTTFIEAVGVLLRLLARVEPPPAPAHPARPTQALASVVAAAATRAAVRSIGTPSVGRVISPLGLVAQTISELIDSARGKEAPPEPATKAPTAQTPSRSTPRSPQPAAHPARTRSVAAESVERIEGLHTLLVRHVLPEHLAELVEELRTVHHHVGDVRAVLLEYLITHPDPIELVASQLSASQLRSELKGRTGHAPPPTESGPAMAEALLAHLGFPRRANAFGLRQALETVALARSRAQSATSEAPLRGAVVEAAGALEAVGKILLRFVCHIVFDQVPELHFRAVLLDKGFTLQRSSLGTVLELLSTLAAELEEVDPAPLSDVAKLLCSTPLAPEGVGGLAALRNRFAHANPEKPPLSLSDWRRNAQEFFESAETLVKFYSEHRARLFPRLVTITDIHIDRWGRRLVEGEDEDRLRERIFTERDDLQPGQMYFMYPLSNPLRVFPILLPAGELLSSRKTEQDG